MANENGHNANNGIKKGLDEALSYTLLTEDVNYPGSATPGSPGAPASPLGSIVEGAVRQVLGWRPRSGDPKGFIAALNQSFDLTEVQGHTEFKWTPRSYAIQADLGAVTGAQAAIYSRAKAAVDQSVPLLDGLKPLRADSDAEDTVAMRSLVRQRLHELVNELGMVGGPRLQRVESIFTALLGVGADPSDPENVGGLLGALGERFGFERSRVNTIDEEQNLTNWLIVVDQTFAIQQTWNTQKRFFSRNPASEDVFLGTQLVLLSRALEVVAEAVHEVTFAMDSVFLGPAERQTIKLTNTDPQLTIAELLSWAERFATEEGVHMVQDGGKDGVIAMQPTLDLLTELVGYAADLSAQPSDNPTPAFHSTRVQRSLEELETHLDNARVLANQIRRLPDPDPQLVEPEHEFLGAAVRVTIEGDDFQDGARVYLEFSEQPDVKIAATRVIVTSAASLRATFDLSQPEAEAGIWSVLVVNPDGGEGSLLDGFTILEPQFRVTDYEPKETTAGGPDFTVTIWGPGFQSNSQVLWGGKPRATSFDAALQTLSVQILEEDIAEAGMTNLMVITPGRQPALIELPFKVNSPMPVIAKLSQAEIPAGQPLPGLVVEGSGFVAGSVVHWDDDDLPTKYLSGQALEAEVSSLFTRDPGTFKITVVNPDPGGMQSNALDFTVTEVGEEAGPLKIWTLDPQVFSSFEGEDHEEDFVIYGENFPKAPELNAEEDVTVELLDRLDEHRIRARLIIPAGVSGGQELTVSNPVTGEEDSFNFLVTTAEEAAR